MVLCWRHAPTPDLGPAPGHCSSQMPAGLRTTLTARSPRAYFFFATGFFAATFLAAGFLAAAFFAAGFLAAGFFAAAFFAAMIHLLTFLAFDPHYTHVRHRFRGNGPRRRYSPHAPRGARGGVIGHTPVYALGTCRISAHRAEANVRNACPHSDVRRPAANVPPALPWCPAREFMDTVLSLCVALSAHIPKTMPRIPPFHRGPSPGASERPHALPHTSFHCRSIRSRWTARDMHRALRFFRFDSTVLTTCDTP